LQDTSSPRTGKRRRERAFILKVLQERNQDTHLGSALFSVGEDQAHGTWNPVSQGVGGWRPKSAPEPQAGTMAAEDITYPQIQQDLNQI
jgi:hypothetical protein